MKQPMTVLRGAIVLYFVIGLEILIMISPAFVAEVEVHNLVLQDVRDLPPETGWGRVPTPVF